MADEDVRNGGDDAPEEPAAAGESADRRPEEAIRERVRDATAQLFRTGRIDADSMKGVGEAMTEGLGGRQLEASPPEESFADAVIRLDAALQNSAQSVHAALQLLAAKGDTLGDGDLHEALDALAQLQHDYVAAASRVAEAGSGALQDEIRELMGQAQRVGSDAAAQVGTALNEFADRFGTASRESASAGLELTREYGIRMASLTSGVLAGLADALREQAEPKDKAE